MGNAAHKEKSRKHKKTIVQSGYSTTKTMIMVNPGSCATCQQLEFALSLIRQKNNLSDCSVIKSRREYTLRDVRTQRDSIQRASEKRFQHQIGRKQTPFKKGARNIANSLKSCLVIKLGCLLSLLQSCANLYMLVALYGAKNTTFASTAQQAPSIMEKSHCN